MPRASGTVIFAILQRAPALAISFAAFSARRALFPATVLVGMRAHSARRRAAFYNDARAGDNDRSAGLISTDVVVKISAMLTPRRRKYVYLNLFLAPLRGARFWRASLRYCRFTCRRLTSLFLDDMAAAVVGLKRRR